MWKLVYTNLHFYVLFTINILLIFEEKPETKEGEDKKEDGEVSIF